MRVPGILGVTFTSPPGETDDELDEATTAAAPKPVLKRRLVGILDLAIDSIL